MRVHNVRPVDDQRAMTEAAPVFPKDDVSRLRVLNFMCVFQEAVEIKFRASVFEEVRSVMGQRDSIDEPRFLINAREQREAIDADTFFSSMAVIWRATIFQRDLHDARTLFRFAHN